MMTKYVLIAYIYCLGMYGGFCLLLYFLILNKKGGREMNNQQIYLTVVITVNLILWFSTLVVLLGGY